MTTYKYFLLLIILFLGIENAYQQFVPSAVEKSEQKIIYRGKIYYVHEITSGQTLYSIAKAYEVTVDDILNANPGTEASSLTTGTTIRIPGKQDENINISPAATIKKKDTTEKDNFYYHTVKKGQTLYFLYKKYNVPQEEIIKHNEEIVRGLKEGQVVKIPKNYTPTPTQNEFGIDPQPEYVEFNEDELYYSYQVKAGDTLYSLSKAYQVSLSEIIATNPNLRMGLQAGMILKIPKKSDVAVDFTKIDTSYNFGIPTYSFAECDSLQQEVNQNTVKVALLLPLRAKNFLIQDSLYTHSSDSIKKAGLVRPATIKQWYYEFYQGFLLAADSLKRAGKHIDLQVYDTEFDTLQVYNITNVLRQSLPEIIVGPGPFFPQEVNRESIKRINKVNLDTIAKVAKEIGAVHVLPFTRKTEILKNHPRAYQLLPNFSNENYALATFIRDIELPKYFNHINDSLGKQRYTKFTEKSLQITLDTNYTDSVAITAIPYFRDTISDHLMNILNPDTINIIVLDEMNAPIANNVYSKLWALHINHGFQFQVMGRATFLYEPSIRLEPMHEFNTVFYNAFKINYDHSLYEWSMVNCKRKFNYFPSNYFKALDNNFYPSQHERAGDGFNFTFYGVETGLHFMESVLKYGKFFASCTECIESDLFQSKYNYKRLAPGSGFVNTSGTIQMFSSEYDITLLREF